MAALSLELGLVTKASVPHLLVNAFKNVLAVSLESGYKIDALEAAMNAAASAPV
jgi:large subunit ribosomal protein LP0